MATLLATFVLSGCGDGYEDEPEGYVRAFKAPALGAALTGAIDTESISVAQDFAFDTSRTLDIVVDIADARDKAASVSVCTDFQPGGGAFEVDYSSCSLQGELVEGRFTRQMLVTNEFDSVAVVVWYRDAQLTPVYREITVEEGKHY